MCCVKRIDEPFPSLILIDETTNNRVGAGMILGEPD
jgi:hypothetical protein